MFDNCDTCEKQNTETIFVNGSSLCYSCASLIDDLSDDLDLNGEVL